jgi:hypothetical protein
MSATDLNNLEREIAAELQKNRNRFVPPSTEVDAPALAMPAYVEHRDGATEIGRLSAEAIVREYEVAAKDIEATGDLLIERIKECEAMTHNALAVTAELKEIAARYREEAKRVFAEIESCSQTTAEVRQTCAELMEKITLPATTDRPKQKKKQLASLNIS